MLAENQKKALAELFYRFELNNQLWVIYNCLGDEKKKDECQLEARILEERRAMATELLGDDVPTYWRSFDPELVRARARREAEKSGRELIEEYSARANALLKKLEEWSTQEES